jgi:excisionase family DNA binding protein
MPLRPQADRALLNTREASEIAHLSPAHLSLLLRERKLEGVKLGRDWLVYEDSLHAFLAHPRKTGPKGPRRSR